MAPGELEDAVEGAGGELQPLGGGAQQRLGGGIHLAEGAHLGGTHLGVDAHPLMASETAGLPLIMLLPAILFLRGLRQRASR